MTPATKIRATRLTKTYAAEGRRPVEALHAVDLTVEAGEFLTIVGPSGCGKSTLLRICAGLEPPTSGVVELVQQDETSSLIALVLQGDSLFPWLTVAGNVAYGLGGRRARRQKAHEVQPLLDLVGLGNVPDAYPHELSMGMRCRASVARALASDSEILLLDEPFAAVDALTRAGLQQELLRICHQLGKTAVMVTHDLDEAVLLGDRVLVLSERPGHVRLELDVPIGRRRDVTTIQRDAAFRDVQSRLWEALGPESSV